MGRLERVDWEGVIEPKPLAPGSISLRLYPHDLPGVERVAELCAQASLAERAGFDGVMTSEHHGGFRGYLPNPVQMAGWCLEHMQRAWAAPCPVLLPLRHWTHVAEELAWLACRFPQRVGAGFAAGGWSGDFELADVPYDERMQRFKAALPRLVAALRGEAAPPLASDAALEACAAAPLAMLCAAMSPAAVRRAAGLSLGVLFDSLQTVERIRSLSDAHRAAGGGGARVLIRRVWIGAPPAAQLSDQMRFYRGYTSEQAQAHWGEGRELVAGRDGSEVAVRLAEIAERSGCDALNLRVHVHGVGAGAIRDQIERLGTETLPRLRDRLAWRADRVPSTRRQETSPDSARRPKM